MWNRYGKNEKSRNRSKFNGRKPGSNFSGHSNNRFGNRDSGPKKKYLKTLREEDILRIVEENSKRYAFQEKSTSEVSVAVSTKTFENFNLSSQIYKNVKNRGYVTPTPIQEKAIPTIMSGRDVIGNANTGTGKTAAFLIPLVDKILKNKNEKVLIVAPTRELATQIYDEFRIFSAETGIYTALCIGGCNIDRQLMALRRNPNFVIGTPGRIKDFIKQNALDLSKFRNVVLDETDLMVDIGFLTDIKFFISLLPKNRQSLFFSATVTPKIEEIIKLFVQNPVSINVKHQDTAENIFQRVVKTGNKKKIEVLHEMLNQKEFEKVLIFGRTKHGVQQLANELVDRGFRADAIHGNKRQNQRQLALNKFKKNEITILLATDVASRGLDISNVSHVINYDLPESYEDYIHRIGRTGRANMRGEAVTIIGR